MSLTSVTSINGNLVLGGYGQSGGAYTLQYQDGSGIVTSIQQQQQLQSQGGKRKRIGPRLYFNYVKSKLNKLETKKLKSRLQKLQALLKNAAETGQTALYEELSKMLLVAVRESEAVACGYSTYVLQEHINKFRYTVTENESSQLNPVEFKKLEEFPRAVPANIQKVIKATQKKGVFDELWVLYLDYTKEKIKSNKEKIREKDPVLFGRFSYDPEKFYFIVDWVDEYCDLTLSKFIDTLKTDDEEYDVQVVEDVSVDYLERIKKEIQEREDRLQATRPNNFRDKMVEEEQAELRRLREENSRLRDEKTFLDEDKEIAIEKALKDREQWRQEANQELRDIAAEKDAELQAKKPWYKRLF